MAEYIALPQTHRAGFRSTLVVALALASLVAAAALIVDMRSSSNGTASSAKSNRTHSYAATPDLLRATSQALGHQIYWAGPRANVTYALTVTRGGFVYVRYLTAGAKVGDPRQDFVTIGTAPVARGAESIVRTGLIAPVR